MRGSPSGPLVLNNNGRQLEADSTASLLPVGEWHHIAAVIDGPDGVMRLYKDGVKVAAQDLMGKGVSDTLSDLFIGHKDGYDHPVDNFDGLMDEFFIFGTALDENQINNLMNYNTTVPEPSTLILLATGALGLLAYGWRRRPRPRADHVVGQG